MVDMIIKLASEKPLMVQDAAKEYKVSVRTIYEDLRQLDEWGIVKFEGPPKTGRHVLTEKGKKLLEA